MTTIRDYLQQTPLPRLEARMLLQHVGGFERAYLIAHDDEILPEFVLNILNEMQQARLDGVPMAYLLGEREFYGRIFQVSPDVLIPRPETELLVDCVLEHLPVNGSVWDIGTGSGIIAITCALGRSDSTVYASDISRAALDVAQNNAGRLQAKILFHHGSWFEVAPPVTQKFDVIVSNPPYIRHEDEHLTQGDLRFEPPGALTDFGDGLSAYRELAQKAHEYLHNGGWLMVEHGYDQAAAIRELFAAAGLVNVATRQDYADIGRITLGQKSD